MVSAVVAQILGHEEGCAPFMFNVSNKAYIVRIIMCIYPLLGNILLQMGRWDNATREEIIGNNGSIQTIDMP